MRTYIFLPPIAKVTGGVKVLWQIAANLQNLGREVSFVRYNHDECFMPDNMPKIEILFWEQVELKAEDIWFVPEGWVNALSLGLNKCRCYQYCQSWSQVFSALPANLTWQQLPVSFFAVSDPVAWFLQESIPSISSLPPVIRPYIDKNVYYADIEEKNKRQKKIIKIAWMPRKNNAFAARIKEIFYSRNPTKRVVWLPIEAMNQQEVAQTLRESDLFLSTGFPEGFSLPPLEAMACGAIPVGFTGFGGLDYMVQGAKESELEKFGNYKPWYPSFEKDFGANSFYAADADVLDAVFCLEKSIEVLSNKEQHYEFLLAGQRTAAFYSKENQMNALENIWKDL